MPNAHPRIPPEHAETQLPGPLPGPLTKDAAWAEMLARASDKNVRLARIVEILRIGETQKAKTLRRTSLLEEIEKERARIARELHAGAGQPLAGIKMNLELLDEWSESMPEKTRQTVVRLNHLAEAALGQVRAVSHRLHPPDWQDRSLTEALELLVEESGIAQTCETEIEAGPLPEEPPHALKVVLYRCAQECISNVLRHSGATRFSLKLRERNGRIELTVSDNGRGIPRNALKRGGIGISSIREHAHSVGGTLDISVGSHNSNISNSSSGTTIQVSLPVTEEYEEE